MHQLSAQDATFLYAEVANAPMHITSVGLYDPSTGPDGTVGFDDILAQVRSRLHRVRTFREKLLWPPGHVDHPYWIEDESFDLDRHVHRVVLPAPGDWGQLCEQVARLHARPIDVTYPLWEMYVVDGLDAVVGVPEGGFAVVIKVHHAAVDGKSGVEMITQMHTQHPVERDTQPTPAWQPEPPPPAWELWMRAGRNAFTLPDRGARFAARLWPRLAKAQMTSLHQPAESAPPPVTRFNGPLGGERVVDARFFELEAVKRLRSVVPGSTVNDVALAVLGGAIRDYLQRARDLPVRSLRAMTPISVRTDDEHADMGNQVAAMVVSLGTDIADPAERLAAVHRSTTASKEWTSAIGARSLAEMSQFMPGALIGLGARIAGEVARRGGVGAYNTVVTNVPGPRHPLYLAGARLVRNFMEGPLSPGVGLFNVVTSYAGELTLSFVADRAMMPDPAAYADCIDRSMAALVAAA